MNSKARLIWKLWNCGLALPNSITHTALLPILSSAQRFFSFSLLVCVLRMCWKLKHLHSSSYCSLDAHDLSAHLTQVRINHCHRPAYSWPLIKQRRPKVEVEGGGVYILFKTTQGGSRTKSAALSIPWPTHTWACLQLSVKQLWRDEQHFSAFQLAFAKL